MSLSFPASPRLLRAACFFVFALLTLSFARAASATVYYADLTGTPSNNGTS